MNTIEPPPLPSQSKVGIASFVCCLSSIGFFILGVIVSMMMVASLRSNPQPPTGFLMTMGAFMTLSVLLMPASLVLGVISLFSKGKKNLFGIIAVCLSGFMCLFMVPLLAAIAVPNFLRARIRAQAVTLVNDVRMIQSAAEQYGIENEFSRSDTVSFDDLVQADYFKKGSKIHQGQSSMTFPRELTYGAVFTEIHPGRKLEVPEVYRNLFTPTLNTHDRIWE
ncbi:MAG: hypothetical protein SFY92_11990 [Verrucomicrobiae bacterium]|nr:hypothetical protein [Verrucomicrobiae bacterium]